MTDSRIADVSTAIGRRSEGDARGTVPALTIASHPSAKRVGDRLVLDALAAGKEVALSRNAPDFVAPGRAIGEPLADPFVSRTPIRFVPLSGGRIRIVHGESGTRPGVPPAELGRDDLAAGVAIELAERIVLVLHDHDPQAGLGAPAASMVGHSDALERIREAIARVADLEVPILVRGETGTGKELAARAIHDLGPRRGRPFVGVNLGALPRELAAAELFGATRGAFTGAVREREGLFSAARGGTLFLDEVGDAAPEVQLLLLRVLETGEMRRVGSEQPIATDVRIVAATDADLEERIRDGAFKAPLLHRLAGYEVRMPPLRERRADIGPLFCHFARQELEALGEAHRLVPTDAYAKAWLPAALAAGLIRHDWPGNVRQLRNVTRQLVIGSRGLAQVRPDARIQAELATAAPPASPPRRRPSEVSDDELVEALRASGWDLKSAADRLRIPRPSIYDLIDKNPSLRTAGDLGADEIEACFRACGGDLEAMVGRLQVSRRALGRRLKELGLR